MDGYAQGEVAAFEVLFARYEARAYAFFVRRVRSAERAEDLYQELFLRIHRARRSYDSRHGFAPWLFQIARRLVIDDLRRAAVRPELGHADDAAGCVDPRPRPDAVLATDEAFAGALERLTEVERYVLVESKVEGRPYAELAGELGKSVAAIKKLASRAMQRLREREPHGAVRRALA
jgi:RNA polymerase sigma-70 factor (ECF subfamily)